MSVRYGNPDCQHLFVDRTDGYEEGCGPAVCLKCGAFACYCDLPHPRPPKADFFGRGVPGNANPNGKWKNPYVKKVP